MSEVQITKQDAVTIIQLNRPDVRNAINVKTAQLLREAWLDFDQDESAKVGILTGSDSTFCAGADLRDVEALLKDADSSSGPLGIGRMSVSKPTIAAVSGYAVAGGFELALWCDLCIVDETAVFGFFERRFGVPMLNGGSQRLPQIVGLRRALDIILTGRAVVAQEAYEIGIASELVGEGEALRRAIELGTYLASVPQICLKNDRRAVYGGIDVELAAGLQIEAMIAGETIASGEPFAGAEQFQSGKGRGGKVD